MTCFQIVTGEADLGFTFATHSKYSDMCFSDPVFDTQMVYFTNARKPVNNYANALKPFTRNVWFCILGMVLFVTMVLTLMMGFFERMNEYTILER